MVRGVALRRGVAAAHGARQLSAYSKVARSQFVSPSRKELRADVKRLGKVLGAMIEQDDPTVFKFVEELRNLGKEFRKNRDDEKVFEKMTQEAKKMTAQQAKGVARAYAQFLGLSNCAETHHRVLELDELRLNKDQETSAFPPKPDTCRGAITALLEEEGLSPAQVSKKNEEVDAVTPGI
jgi:phosphoenolpyruvate carboxylase